MGPTTFTPDDTYITLATGPANFGSGSGRAANSGSGDLVGIFGFDGELAVPDGYISGTALSDSAIYENATIASLGVTPGTYVWTWGTGANQNFTLQIVPDQGLTFLLLTLALLGLVAFRQQLVPKRS